jgi:hypothetical protein
MDKPQQGWVNAIAQAAAIRQAIRKNVPKGAVAMRTFRLALCGLFGKAERALPFARPAA